MVNRAQLLMFKMMITNIKEMEIYVLNAVCNKIKHWLGRLSQLSYLTHKKIFFKIQIHAILQFLTMVEK